MALWGNKDLIANNGTATVTGTTTVTFSAEPTVAAAVGQFITITDSGTAMIKSVTNTTVSVLASAVTNVSTKVYHTSSAPKWAGKTSEIDSATLYGVDATEQGVVSAAANSTVGTPSHAGWVERVDRGAARVPRYRYETLVAMGSIGGDAEDTVFADS
jgi:hypothetical protein